MHSDDANQGTVDKRTPLIAGNWKMYLAPTRARAFAIELRTRLNDVRDREVAVFPPFVSIPAVAEELERTPIRIGGQDLYWQNEGAYTGAVSASFLADAGCSYVLVGHSERRTVFGDDDQAVGRKFQAARAAGLVPVLCCGESLAEREAGRTADVVRAQVETALAGCPADADFVLAYEPVWAIGTGRTATPAQAAEVHALLRDWLKTRFSAAVAARTRILYGGSVKADNVDELMAQDGVDGVLVGGASLKADSFERIVRFRTG